MKRVELPLVVAWLLASPRQVFAHDPPPDENPYVHILVEHVLQTIPGWLFVVAVVLLAVLVWAGCVWLRALGGARFVDRPE